MGGCFKLTDPPKDLGVLEADECSEKCKSEYLYSTLSGEGVCGCLSDLELEGLETSGQCWLCGYAQFYESQPAPTLRLPNSPYEEHNSHHYGKHHCVFKLGEYPPTPNPDLP